LLADPVGESAAPLTFTGVYLNKNLTAYQKCLLEGCSEQRPYISPATPMLPQMITKLESTTDGTIVNRKTVFLLQVNYTQ
jgi:hypothetical protein